MCSGRGTIDDEIKDVMKSIKKLIFMRIKLQFEKIFL